MKRESSKILINDLRKSSANFISSSTINGARSLLKRENVLLTCFPKSGSTYLAEKLGGWSGWTKQSFVPEHKRREQTLDNKSIKKSLLIHKNVIAQHHCNYSEYVMHLINKFDMKVIILTRNIMDVLVSLSDHLDDDPEYMPLSYISRNILNKIDQSNRFTRLQYMVHFYLPWYLSFYTGWLNHFKEIKNKFVFISYDDFFVKKEFNFKKLLDSLDIKLNPENIKEPLFDRKNKGIMGRGKLMFEKDQVAYESLLKILEIYPSVDFSPIFQPI